MQVAGIISIFVGAYLLWASITNQAPIKTLVTIVKDPTKIRDIRGTLPISTKPLASSTTSGTIDTSSYVTGGNSGSSQAAKIVAFARAQIGKPYDSPGDSKNTWDCSGLTKAAVKYGTGIDIAHGTVWQVADTQGKWIARKADVLPGDIVFPITGHCGVATGNGMFVDAPDYGRTVSERAIWAFLGARRFWKDTPAPSGGSQAV